MSWVSVLNINQLKVLIVIEEYGTFSDAAKILGFSQPGISRQVKKTERELGINIFQRSKSGAVPTQKGLAVLQFAKETIRSYQNFLESITEKNSLNGMIKVIASTTPGEYILPAIIAGFNDRYPSVTVETRITNSNTVTAEIDEGKSDVGFIGTNVSKKTIVHKVIAKDEIVLALPVGHEFERHENVELSQLSNQRLLKRESGSGTYESLFRILKERKLSMPEHTNSITLGSTQAIISAVNAGIGIGFVTTRALSHYNHAQISFTRLHGIPLFRHLFLIHKHEAIEKYHVNSFINFAMQSTIPLHNTLGTE